MGATRPKGTVSLQAKKYPPLQGPAVCQHRRARMYKRRKQPSKPRERGAEVAAAWRGDSLPGGVAIWRGGSLTGCQVGWQRTKASGKGVHARHRLARGC